MSLESVKNVNFKSIVFKISDFFGNEIKAYFCKNLNKNIQIKTFKTF